MTDPDRAQPSVLIVDDDPGVLQLLRLTIEEAGMTVASAGTGEAALAALTETTPDVVLLDVMLPDFTGLELMRRARAQRPVPIVMLSACDAPADVIRGLELGADDYCPKPFNPDEVVARIRAVLRRAGSPASTEPVLAYGDLTIDLAAHLVTRAGAVVELTRSEWGLLDHLARHPGKVLPSRQILTAVWGIEYADDLQYLRVWVSRLRRKLEPDGERTLIRTFQGIGYRLEPPPTRETDAPAGGEQLSA